MSCGGESACFALDESDKYRLQADLMQEKIELVSLPNVRAIERVFKYLDQDVFIVVDTARYERGFDRYEIIFSHEGETKFLEIASVSHPLGSRNIRIGLENGLVLAWVVGQDDGSLTSSNGKSSRLRTLPPEEITPDFLAKLGLPNSRYGDTALRTPCEVLETVGRN